MEYKFKFKFKGLYLTSELLKSRAFIKLMQEGGKALAVFIIFMEKRTLSLNPNKRAKRIKKYIITNNGQITFYYREAKNRYGFSYCAFSKAIDKLIELGFIDIAQQGVGWARTPTLYTISDRWENYDSDDFEAKIRGKKFNYKFKEGHEKYSGKEL